MCFMIKMARYKEMERDEEDEQLKVDYAVMVENCNPRKMTIEDIYREAGERMSLRDYSDGHFDKEGNLAIVRIEQRWFVSFYETEEEATRVFRYHSRDSSYEGKTIRLCKLLLENSDQQKVIRPKNVKNPEYVLIDIIMRHHEGDFDGQWKQEEVVKLFDNYADLRREVTSTPPLPKWNSLIEREGRFGYLVTKRRVKRGK